MVVLGPHGEAQQNSDACSGEVVDMHLAVYRARPQARAVVHTHSPALTAFALANRPLPCRYETLHRFGGQLGDVPVAPWTPGRRDEAFIEGIFGALDAHPSTKAVLLANHGVLALASSPADAAMLIIALEEAAAAELGASVICGGKHFPEPSGTVGSPGGRACSVGSER
ncbi:MAG TPA: class II aldolase/adducin family protein, partial [Acidimicrobiales bacterium]|nr:class II aldolase/adducin family protein [Acidimicrobiales bacterium]